MQIHPDHTTDVVLGARVRTVRQAHQPALRPEALAAALTVSHITVYRLERGQGIRSAYLPRLAAVLGVSLDYLFGLTDDPTPRGDQARAEAASVPS